MLDYEKMQNFNWLVSFMHSMRYKHLIDLVEQISSEKKLESIRIVDIGCAHGKIFEVLKDKFNITYLGIELKKEVADIAVNRYGNLTNFRLINDAVQNHFKEFQYADLIVAFETLEHIPENIVVRIIERISLASPKAFLCSVPNEVGPIVFIKNFASLVTGYIRHKEYSWRDTLYASVFNLDKIETHKTGHKGFDWRWLAQTIRHNMSITKIYTTPFRFLPRIFSFSIIFICIKN